MKEAIQFIKNIGSSNWEKVLAYGILLAGVYYSTFTWLITKDWSREDYNYAYLIPLIVLYLLWEKRTVLTETLSVKSWIGILPLVFGLALFWLGELGGALIEEIPAAELIVIEFVILLGYIRSGGRNRCRSLELYLMEMR